MKVICISGKAQHGKDTVATYLKESLENDGYNVLITHYADLLKYICITFFGWDGNKDEYGRSILQRVGTDTVRNADQNFWVQFVVDILKFFPDKWDYVLIPDCRFPNEVDVMKENFETLYVRVERPNAESLLTPEQQTHPSETSLDFYTPDYSISNSGTLRDLRKSVAELMCDINGEHQYSFDEL